MSDIVDPKEFIITRKRKKYRFALFNNSSLCFEFDEWKRRAVDVVEVGAGTGLFCVELATKHPDQSFLAIDVKGDRLQKGAREAETRGLKNISFVRARADQLDQLVENARVSSVWLTFPDPFRKSRSSGRRLTHPTYLNIYRRLLNENGALYLKHDNSDFFSWSLERLVQTGWQIKSLSFDLHNSELLSDYKTKTSYESRWLSEGRVTSFVKAAPSKNKDANLYETIINGGVAVLRTDTLYGLVGLASDELVVKRIHKIKKRSRGKPLIVLIASAKDAYDNSAILQEYADIKNPTSTIVKSPSAPEWLKHDDDTVAYRVPSSAWLRDLLEKTGPIVAPSANPEGLAPALDIHQARKYFRDNVDYYHDSGEVPDNQPPSRIIRINESGESKRLR